MKESFIIAKAITEQTACGIWAFYPEVMDLKKDKKSKCCKNYKKDKRCKKCPMHS